jgi:hypothetical protein
LHIIHLYQPQSLQRYTIRRVIDPTLTHEQNAKDSKASSSRGLET